MHKQSGTSESQVRAGRTAGARHAVVMPDWTWLASLMGKGMGLKVPRLVAVLCCSAGVVTGLLCTTGPVSAQQAAWDDGQDDTPTKPVAVEGQAVNTIPTSGAVPAPGASPSISYQRYSNNRQTNARLNAVFDLIATQGDGLVWDSEHHPIRPKTAAGSVQTAAVLTPTVVTAPAGGAASAPLAASSASTPGVASAPALQTWTFAASGSLQETLISWAQQAGWQAPDWQASQPYTIMSTEPITGTFLDAIKVIAAAEPGLDIKILMANRKMKIVDHKSI